MADELQAFDAADDEPDQRQEQNQPADQDMQRDEADHAIEQPDPEGANLETVVRPHPVGHVVAIDIGDDPADEVRDLDDQADEIENVNDGRGSALRRIAAGNDRLIHRTPSAASAPHRPSVTRPATGIQAAWRYTPSGSGVAPAAASAAFE